MTVLVALYMYSFCFQCLEIIVLLGTDETSVGILDAIVKKGC